MSFDAAIRASTVHNQMTALVQNKEAAAFIDRIDNKGDIQKKNVISRLFIHIQLLFDPDLHKNSFDKLLKKTFSPIFVQLKTTLKNDSASLRDLKTIASLVNAVIIHLQNPAKPIEKTEKEHISDLVSEQIKNHLSDYFAESDRIEAVILKPNDTGISAKEAQLIQNYVAVHLEDWKKEIPPDGFMRLEKSPSKIGGLPRTLEVFKAADGNLHVMVLCKTKGNIKALGKGGAKSAKLAVEWLSGERMANLVIKDNPNIGKLKAEAALMQKVGGQPGIADPMKFVHAYQKAGGEDKVSLFMPMYKSSLEKLPKRLSLEDKRILAKDIIDGLGALERAGIEHRDLKTDNIFLERKEGKYRARIADFGESREMENLAETPRAVAKEKFSTLLIGTETIMSPEKRFFDDKLNQSRNELSKLRMQIKKAEKAGDTEELRKLQPQVIELAESIDTHFKSTVDGFWNKTDIFSAGIALLQLHVGNVNPQGIPGEITALMLKAKSEAQGHHGDFVVRGNAAMEKYLSSIPGISAIPSQDLNLIKDMLTFHHAERPTATQCAKAMGEILALPIM